MVVCGWLWFVVGCCKLWVVVLGCGWLRLEAVGCGWRSVAIGCVCLLSVVGRVVGC